MELPKGCQVHPTFHVSQLKHVAGVNNTITTTFLLSADLGLTSRPADVLWVRQQRARPQEVLVLGEGSEEFEVTWKDATKIFKAYPNAHLEDKVLNSIGGIVIPMEEGIE